MWRWTFGTGCVKMTPAHDPNDFEVGLRHNLEVIRVLDDNGEVNADGGNYRGDGPLRGPEGDGGQTWKQAGYLMEKIEELRPTTWAPATAATTTWSPSSPPSGLSRWSPWPRRPCEWSEDGEVKFVPERFSKTYLNWMENVRDWCISRQLWWGHQIPAWYCADCGHMTVHPGGRHGGLRSTAAAPEHHPGPGRAGHLVLLRPVALLHPGLAG